MNIREAILAEHSKAQTMRIVNYVGNDKERFKELMKIFLHGEYRVTQRAAWVVSYCGTAHPHLIRPYMKQLIARAKEKGIHDAVKRNIVKVWEEVELPEELHGEIYDLCFYYLRSLDEPVAVKALSMTVLQRISNAHPELKAELKQIIEDMMPFAPPAISSRGKKVLKQLQKI